MYLFLLIILSFINCNKDKNCLDDCKIDPPKIIWRVPLGPQKYDQIVQDPVIYKNKLVMGYQSGFQKEGYYIYDKYEGKVIHEISNIHSFDPVSQLYKNKYISKVGRNLRIIDLENFNKSEIEFPNYPQTTVILLQVCKN